jgi:hypothetical protein
VTSCVRTRAYGEFSRQITSWSYACVRVRAEGVKMNFYVCRITFYLLFDRKNEPIRMRTVQKKDNAN